MDLADLKSFWPSPTERSFSRAAAKVHRTQPAVSQAVRRLEVELGERLFDRSSKTGTLTEAGRMLQNYGQRLVRLAEETESAVSELRDLRRGRVLIGANEAAVHALLPLISRFRQNVSRHHHRRTTRAGAPDRGRGAAGQPRLRRTDVPSHGEGLLEVPVGTDELVLLVPPSHRLRDRHSGVTMADFAARAGRRPQRSIAGARTGAAALRAAPVPAQMVIALPSLDGIKRAVELKWASRCCLADAPIRNRPWRTGRASGDRNPRRARCGWCSGRRIARTPPRRSS